MKYNIDNRLFEIKEMHRIFLVYFLIAAVFIGTHLFAINLFVGSFSLYRISVLINLFIFFVYSLKNYNRLNFFDSLNLVQYDLVFIFWLLWAFLSVFWVISFSRWIQGTFFVTFGILSILLVSNIIVNKQIMKNILTIMFTMILFHQIIGFFEIITNMYFLNDNGSSVSSGLGLPVTIFKNVNDYTTLIFLGIPLSLIIYNTTDKLLFKCLSIISGLFSLILLAYTDSRANQLALLIFILTFIILKLHVKLSYFKKPIIILLSGFIVFILLYILFDDIRLIVYSILNNFFSQRGSNTFRVNMLLNGLIFLFRTFGIGVGAGNIEYWMIEYQIFNVDAPNIHNWFFDILVGYGVIVFILYIILYVVVIQNLYQSFIFSKDRFYKSTSLFLLCYVIAFIFSSLSSASNIFIEWQWVVWGVIVGYVKLLNYKSLK